MRDGGTLVAKPSRLHKGQREEPLPGSTPGRSLKVGDEIRVGSTTLRVWLVEPADTSMAG